MDIGRTIAGLRDRSGLTQEQLADMIFVSKDLVSKWETGKSRPDYNSVLRMAGVFTVDPEEIVRTSDLIFSELSSCLPERFAGKVDEMTAAINSFFGAAERMRPQRLRPPLLLHGDARRDRRTLRYLRRLRPHGADENKKQTQKIFREMMK